MFSALSTTYQIRCKLYFGLKLLRRGGVEDTRLEAKAKDTKKIRGQGQGQPFRGQTLSIEAKDRNTRGQGQGPRTQAQVLSKKKKSLHKNFSGDLGKKKKKGLHKNFSSDLHKKNFF